MSYKERIDVTHPAFSAIERRLHYGRYTFVATLDLGRRVLDCACGIGYGSDMISRTGDRNVLGVDVSEEAISEARRRYGSSGAEFRVADAYDLRSLSGPFSAIISFETIEHVANPSLVLKNFAASLEPGGILIISTPNGSVTSPIRPLPPANPYHQWEDNPPQFVRRLENAGFAVRESYGQAHLSRNMRLLYRIARGRGQLLARGLLSGLETRILRLESALIRRLQSGVVGNSQDAAPSAEHPLHTYVYQLHVCERIERDAPA